MSNNNSKKITVIDLKLKKKKKEKITCLTCYDYFSAKILDDCNIDVVLVGDSLGMVFKGEENTLSVTLDEIIYHTKAVKKGLNRAFLVADMPFGSYQVDKSHAIKNAIKIIKDGGAEAVKLEGGKEIEGIVKSLTDYGINVVAHIGLTPQYIHKIGGFKIQGKSSEISERLIEDALILENAGACMIVLEGMVHHVASQITQKLAIPTIGIGAGRDCDGQILVFHDYLGYNVDFIPSFAKTYTNVANIIQNATEKYIEEVKKGTFP